VFDYLLLLPLRLYIVPITLHSHSDPFYCLPEFPDFTFVFGSHRFTSACVRYLSLRIRFFVFTFHLSSYSLLSVYLLFLLTSPLLQALLQALCSFTLPIDHPLTIQLFLLIVPLMHFLHKTSFVHKFLEALFQSSHPDFMPSGSAQEFRCVVIRFDDVSI
jgi:hypothetical protein